MATVSEIVDRINAATDNIAADVRGLKTKLEDALAGSDAAATAAVQDALAQFEPLAARLEEIAAETPDEPAPSPEPAPEEPPASPATPDAPTA